MEKQIKKIAKNCQLFRYNRISSNKMNYMLSPPKNKTKKR